jgi:hypothetical protein
MKKLFSIFLFLSIAVSVAVGQSTEETVSAAIKVGNYKELSKHFDTKVELNIASKEDSYSKAQAELIIKDFFAKEKVTSYNVIHRGKSPDGAKYAIGTLQTSSGKYRTYILTKDVGGNTRIQQLRIEAND